MWGPLLASLILLTSTPICINNIRQSNYDNVISGITYSFINCSIVDKDSVPYIDKNILKENLLKYFNNNLNSLNKKYTLKLTYYDDYKNITFTNEIKGVTIFVSSDMYFYKYEKGITYYIEKDE